MSSDTYYEVWQQDYNTFGESEAFVTARYTRRDAAERHAELISHGWGTRARVEEITEARIEDLSPEEVDAQFEWIFNVYPELKRRKTKTQRRQARKGKP